MYASTSKLYISKNNKAFKTKFLAGSENLSSIALSQQKQGFIWTKKKIF
jgi:hypothetical protein